MKSRAQSWTRVLDEENSCTFLMQVHTGGRGSKTKFLRSYKLAKRPELDPFLRRRRFCRIRQKLNKSKRPEKQQNNHHINAIQRFGCVWILDL